MSCVTNTRVLVRSLAIQCSIVKDGAFVAWLHYRCVLTLHGMLHSALKQRPR